MSHSTTTAEQIVAQCFLAPRPCQKLHIHYLLTTPQVYLEALDILTRKNLLATLSQATKARILVALHVTQQHAALKQFLSHCDVVEITKACEILDRPRWMRQIERKMQTIATAHPHVLENKADAEPPRHKRRRRRGTAVEPQRKRRTRKYDVLQRQLKTLTAAAQDEDHGSNFPCSAAHANTAVQELLDSASVSGALAAKIRAWVRAKFTADLLEFIVMSGSTAVWKKLADLVHFRSNDFPLDFFLSVAHGAPIPEGTFVHGMRRLMDAPQAELATTFEALAQEHPQVYKSYTFLRTCPRFLQEKAITALLAQHIPLGTAIWYLEELCGTAGPTFDSDIPLPGTEEDEEEQLRRALAASMGESVDKVEPDLVVASILSKRLRTEDAWMQEESNNKVAASFAKLVERILEAQTVSSDLAEALMPAAKRRLRALQETVNAGDEKKTAVFGDASESMQTAIKAATIFAAMVSVCWGGELCFFADRYIPSPHARPQTVEQVLEICAQIQAKNCTNLAAALWHYYERKIVLQRIVLVTDEWENEACHGFLFADLLRRYKEEVSPDVELLVVGVGDGSMGFQESLRRNGIDFKRIEIDERRPDLTKLDALLRQMSLLSATATPAQEEKEASHEADEDFVLVED